MLKHYLMPNGHIYQYEEGTEPEGAVLVEAKKTEPSDKAAKPVNKARRAARK